MGAPLVGRTTGPLEDLQVAQVMAGMVGENILNESNPNRMSPPGVIQTPAR